ncbi:MAG: glyoxalase/bleomycin resistance/extradiol dioxygenase family protein [Bacillota bacterium]|nr:glyoxalase/bleomycin resistance/extradiol dioxygenase family protein [Bacillota bacterium]
MTVNVYVNFNGNCREAVEFYAQVFGSEKPQFMTFGETSPNLSEEAKSLVLHTQLNITGSTLMFSDCAPGRPLDIGNNISLTVVSKNMDEIKSYFSQLKEDGNVIMELQETFWSKCYGMLTDKFGINWQLSYENE